MQGTDLIIRQLKIKDIEEHLRAACSVYQLYIQVNEWERERERERNGSYGCDEDNATETDHMD